MTHDAFSATGDVGYGRVGAAPTLDLKLIAKQIDQPELVAILGQLPTISPPAGLRIKAILSVGSAAVAGYPIRDLRIAVSTTGGDPISTEITGVLPGDARATLSGIVSDAAELDGKAEVRANALAPVLDAFGLPAALMPGDGSGPSVLIGDLRANGSEIRLENLRLTNGGASVSGRFVARPQEWPSLSLALSSGDDNDPPEVILNLDRHDDGSDAWDFEAHIAAAAASLDLRGNARLDPGQPAPVLRASVEAGDIDVAGLIDWVSGASAPGQAAAAAPEMAALAALALLHKATATMEIAAAGLVYRGERVDAPRLSLQWEDGALTLDVLSGRYRDGAIKGAVRGRPGKSIDMSGQMEVRGAVLSGLDDGPVGLAAGRLDADLRFSGAGGMGADFLSRLKGDARFEMTDAIVKGLDLGTINKRLAAKRGSVGVVGILTLGLLRGRTAVPMASGTLKIENGIVVVDDTAVTAEGGRAEVFGSADLARGILDAAAHLRFDAHPSAPPVIMRLSGALAAPNFVLDPKPLQRWLKDNRR